MKHKRLAINSLMDLQQYILTLHNNPKVYSLDDLLAYLHNAKCSHQTLSRHIYYYTYMDKGIYALPQNEINRYHSHNWYAPSKEIYIFPDTAECNEADTLLIRSIYNQRMNFLSGYREIITVKIFVSLDYFIHIYTPELHNDALISISLVNRYNQLAKYYLIHNIHKLANILKDFSLPKYLRDKIEAYYFGITQFYDN